MLHFIRNLAHQRLDSKDKLSVAIEMLATKLKNGKMLRRDLWSLNEGSRMRSQTSQSQTVSYSATFCSDRMMSGNGNFPVKHVQPHLAATRLQHNKNYRNLRRI
jgi:hypothetical protein